MTEAVIVSAVRTAIATAHKGTLSETTGEVLATHIVREAIARSGLAGNRVDDIILAESHYGGGDLARYAAVAAGLTHVPGVSVNRHCAGSLTATGVAAATICAGVEKAIIAGGVQSSSLAPALTWRVPGSADNTETRIPPTFPHTDDASDDVSLSVGWNIAQKYGITREEMDAWAVRSHERAVAAIDAGRFLDEIAPIEVTTKSGERTVFAVDEHPRRNSTLEKAASLKPLHPEIEGFSITAANAAGLNDAASALMLVGEDTAAAEGLTRLATVRGWTSVGVEPRLTGYGAIAAIDKLMDRVGLAPSDIDLWEINEAFASVPVAAVKELGIKEDLVNVNGSGCSLGHPVSASGARMLTTLAHELRRRGGGYGVAAMCAGGGQGGSVLIEVT